MSLRSVHRAASSAKHKTAASFKNVLHLNSSPAVRKRPSQFAAARDNSEAEVRDLPRRDFASSSNKHSRKFELGNSTANSSSDQDTTDDDGYVTANDDSTEFEDSDFENDSDGAADDRVTVSGAQEAISGQGWRPQSDSRGSQNDGGVLPISQLQPINELRVSLVELESEERLKKVCTLSENQIIIAGGICIDLHTGQLVIRPQVDDATLLRFLIARNMDVAKAADMFIKDWRWRNQFAPLGYISEDTVSHQLEAEKAFLQGIDKQGRPLIVIIGSKHFSKGRDMEEFKRYCYYCIEKVISSIPEGKDKFSTIIDLGGTGYKNMDTPASLMMVDFLQAHYPERMGKLYVVRLPSLFHVTYRLVEPAIDMRTRQKIKFVNDGELESVLNADIGEDCVPKMYGGTAELIPIQYARIDRGPFPSKAVLSS